MLYMAHMLVTSTRPLRAEAVTVAVCTFMPRLERPPAAAAL